MNFMYILQFLLSWYLSKDYPIIRISCSLFFLLQGSHSLEKSLNFEVVLEKSFDIIKLQKVLEKYLILLQVPWKCFRRPLNFEKKYEDCKRTPWVFLLYYQVIWEESRNLPITQPLLSSCVMGRSKLYEPYLQQHREKNLHTFENWYLKYRNKS